MTNTLASLSQELTTQQARNARRVAVLLLALIGPALIPFSILAIQLAAWQLYVDTVVLFAYGVATFIGLRLIQRGRVTTGVQIILFGMGLSLLALNLLVAGLGVLLGVTTGLLITVIAQLTLPETAANPIVIVAFGLGLFIVLLDAVLPDYRLNAAELTAIASAAVIIVSIGCLYLISRQFNTYSMRGKLTLTLLLVAIAPLVLQVVSFSVLAESNLRSIAQQRLRAAAQQTADRIDRFFEETLRDVQATAQLPETISFLVAAPGQRDQGKLAAMLDALSSQNGFIRSYAIFDLQGLTVFDTTRVNIGTSQADQSYVQTPLQTGQAYASEVLFDQLTGEGLIHFSAPVRSGSGDIIGVVRVAYSRNAIQDLVVQAGDLGGSESFGLLLDENHFRLANGSTSSPAFKSVVPLSAERLAALKAAGRIPNIADTELSTNLPELEAGLAQAGTESFFVAEAGETIDNRESADVPDQMAAVQLKARPAWLMVFGQPQQVFLAPVQDLSHGSLFLVLAISAIIVLIATRISQILARPILNLTAVATRISEGDLAAQAVVETADEIGALATTFNSTTAQLRGLIGSLEEKVRARTEQLQISTEVGREATSILDPQHLLQEAVNLITDRFGFSYAAIFTLDSTGHSAVLRAATGEAGRVLIEQGHQVAVNSRAPAGMAIATRHACIAPDADVEVLRLANPLLADTRSEITLPLIVGGQISGALDVHSAQTNAFDETNAAVLQSMADQIAIALQNAESFTRSEQQTQTLAALNQLSRELGVAADYESIARAIRTAVVKLIGPQQITLLLTTSDPQRMMLHPLNLDGEPVLLEGSLVETAHSLAGDSLDSGKTIYVPDLTIAPDPFGENAALIQAGFRSTVILPLRVGDKRVGTLNMSQNVAQAYSPEIIHQMEQMAAQLAVVLENHALVRQTQQALTELDAANRRLIGQAWERYTREADVIQGEWREGRWLSGQTDGGAVPDSQDLRVPLKVRGATVGEFCIQALDKQRDWTSDNIAFAQALIDQVGQVIENARLLEETERFAWREQRIRQITDRIRAATDVQAVLQATTAELAQSLGVSRAIMRLTVSDAAVGDGKSREPNQSLA